MEIKASYLAIAGGIEATCGDALLGVLKERGRGFASDSETWAELRLMLEQIKTEVKGIENVHKEMREAVKDRNGDAFSALCQELERSAARIAGDWIRASVMAKIALEDPELPEEEPERSTYYEYKGDMTPEEYEKFRAAIDKDRARLEEIRLRRKEIAAAPRSDKVFLDLSEEDDELSREEAEIIDALEAVGIIIDAESDGPRLLEVSAEPQGK